MEGKYLRLETEFHPKGVEGTIPGAHTGPEIHHVLFGKSEQFYHSQDIGQRIQKVIGAKSNIDQRLF